MNSDLIIGLSFLLIAFIVAVIFAYITAKDFDECNTVDDVTKIDDCSIWATDITAPIVYLYRQGGWYPFGSIKAAKHIANINECRLRQFRSYSTKPCKTLMRVG